MDGEDSGGGGPGRGRGRGRAKYLRWDALLSLACLLAGSAFLLTFLHVKIVVFLMVAVFVLWAVFTEQASWEADEARVAKRRARTRRRARPSVRRNPPPAVSSPHTPPAVSSPHTPPPSSSSPATDVPLVNVHRTRERGPEGRRRRLRRHMRISLAAGAMLLGAAVIVLICTARGCRYWGAP